MTGKKKNDYSTSHMKQRGMLGSGGGDTHGMHGRSRITIDPRTPTMPGRGAGRVFHRPGRHCSHQARSAVRCSASRMKGELHLGTKEPLAGRAFLHMVDSVELIDWLGGVCACICRAPPNGRRVQR